LRFDHAVDLAGRSLFPGLPMDLQPMALVAVNTGLHELLDFEVEQRGLRRRQHRAAAA